MAYDLSTYEGRQKARDDASAQGRSVVVDAQGIYDRGTGQTASGSASAAPGPSGPAPVATPQAGTDQQALQKFFSQTAGFSREELAEKRRQFDVQQAALEAQWTREGRPLLEIKQRLAALEDEKFRADLALAQKTQADQYAIAQRQATVQEGHLGLAQKTQADQNAIALRQAGVQEGQLGLNYLDTASKMGGPSDYFQSVDFNRGASARGDVPVFLNSLATNTSLPSFNAAGMVAPNPQTAAGLAQKLTGTGATSPGGYNTDTALNQIGSIFKRGVTSLQAGSLERLDPSELALLKSGGAKLGYDVDSWLRAYGKSAVGQQAFA